MAKTSCWNLSFNEYSLPSIETLPICCKLLSFLSRGPWLMHHTALHRAAALFILLRALPQPLQLFLKDFEKKFIAQVVRAAATTAAQRQQLAVEGLEGI